MLHAQQVFDKSKSLVAQIFQIYFGVKWKIYLTKRRISFKSLGYLPRSHAAIAARFIISETFEPVVGFMTRYGYVELTNTASSLGNAGDYLGKVAITTANVSFS